MTNCPTCNGSGRVTGLFPVYSPDYRGERKPAIDMECHRCKGTGSITDEMKLWIERGRKLRSERKSRQMTLRSEAARRGMKPSELSYMEQGITEPVDA